MALLLAGQFRLGQVPPQSLAHNTHTQAREAGLEHPVGALSRAKRKPVRQEEEGKPAHDAEVPDILERHDEREDVDRGDMEDIGAVGDLTDPDHRPPGQRTGEPAALQDGNDHGKAQKDWNVIDKDFL